MIIDITSDLSHPVCGSPRSISDFGVTFPKEDLMQNHDALGELQVMEMNESQVNGATTVKYNYLTQNADRATDGRGAEHIAGRSTAPAGR